MGCTRKSSRWNQFVKNSKGTALAGNFRELAKLYRERYPKPDPCRTYKDDIQNYRQEIARLDRALDIKINQLRPFLELEY